MRMDNCKRLASASSSLLIYLQNNIDSPDGNVLDAIRMISLVQGSELPEPNYVPQGELRGIVDSAKEDLAKKVSQSEYYMAKTGV